MSSAAPSNSDTGTVSPLSLQQVLDDEYRLLHGVPAVDGQSSLSDRERLNVTLRAFATKGQSALCLSGGGVRSASFNLGVLQGLAQSGALSLFDYLSTVSGGGYIGGWLSAWRTRAHIDGAPDPACANWGSSDGGTHRTEPAPLTRLRRSIAFLDPHVGLRSLDVWTLVTTILRNLLLNWAVLVPLLAAGALVPRLYLGILGLPSQPELVSPQGLATWYFHDWMVTLPLLMIAAVYAAIELPSLGNRSHGQRPFLIWFLTPIVIAEIVVSMHRYWAWRFEGGFSLRTVMLASTVGMVLPWVIGGAFSKRWWRPWTWIGAGIAGAVGRAIIWSANHGLTEMARDHPQIFASVDLPVTLSLLFVQMTLFVGLASRDMTDEDREWWARAAAWILMVAIVWLIAGILVIYAPILLSKTFSAVGVSERAGRIWLGLLTLATGGAASRLGSSWTRVPTPWQWLERRLFVVAAPLLVVLLTLLLATADLRLLEFFHRLDLFAELPRHPEGASLPEDLMACGLLLLVGLALGKLVSVNDFSLHGMYRKRLARTFLGASRPPDSRHPNLFTGFDDDDDLPIASVAAAGRPLHLLNATLNMVADDSLAMQERRSESFTMSALHAGSRRTGYRPSAEYADTISLGECMTISGAAVSPNMGASSKPALTFLLTLFNARLGVWLGNPGQAGDQVWRRGHAAFGATPLLNELTGRTSDRNPYVYLSDGGHFENLGLYEMVLRRCRYIVVSDAGCDPDYRFDDLANAIRKIRLDFGIDIEFPSGIGIVRSASGLCGARSAVAVIHYSAVDQGASDGVLLYVKATLCGDEPVDVTNYGIANPPFPHQSTTDQWFTEAQLESYRMLGLHTVLALTKGATVGTIADLCGLGAPAESTRRSAERPLPGDRAWHALP
ncbi:MAG TPA: patatin-like phospholipase family protein [Vicinamibacterales bacterium]|nr:patatin-like phospholipase family protein [Vicinamibacterales bacterium]